MAEIAIEEKGDKPTNLPEVNLPAVDWGYDTSDPNFYKEWKEQQLQQQLQKRKTDIVEAQETDKKFTPLPMADYLKGNEKGELVREDVLNNKKFFL